MVNNTFNSGFRNIGGVPMGEPISSPFNPKKHLENSSFDRILGQENTWLGILNILDKYNKVKMPFISATELGKNVIEVDGPGSKLTFGVPFMKGCPFILENICAENPRPGYGNQPFFIVLSENVFANGDTITTDYRNGRQLRIQTVDKKGPDAEIIEHLSGYRYMVALDAYDEETYYPQELLANGTPYMKMFNVNGGEFDNIMSNYSGMEDDDREALQMYEYRVGNSKQAIHAWVTADTTYRNFQLKNKIHPAIAHLDGASTDILAYWTGKGQGVFWIPEFIQKMIGELAKMKENFLTWSQGVQFSNGREKIIAGLGFYPQIKERGNYDTYQDFDQLFDLVYNFSEKLFAIHNQVPVEERVVRLKCGKLAFSELRKRFGKFFKTDNPFTILGDHPALIKAGLLTNDDKGGLIYKPVQFNGVWFPEQGLLVVEHDASLDKIDDWLESPISAANGSRSSGMVFIEDISAGNFTNAIPTGLKKDGMSYKNTTMIKTRGYVDKIEYRVGSDCSQRLLQMLGVTGQGNLVTHWDKGLEMRMSTEGELWVQDPSRSWIIEYDPDGTIAANSFDYSSLNF